MAKMIYFQRIVTLSFIILFGNISTGLFAQGGYAGAFLRMGLGARSESMGRAYTAISGSAESAYFNPASVTAMQDRGIDVSMRSLSLDRRFAYLGFSTAIKPGAKSGAKSGARVPEGGVALTWIHASTTNIDGRDSDGRKFDSFSNYENAINFSFGLKFSERFSAGITARTIWNNFPGLGTDDADMSSRSIGVDLGALVSPMQNVWLGAVIKNLNSKYNWNSDKIYERGTSTKDEFPQVWRLGIATRQINNKLLVAADIEGSKKFDPRFMFGAEYMVVQNALLRAGFRDGNPTFGAAYLFEFKGVAAGLHYAFASQADEIDSDHVFSWSFAF
ncbi:MAG: hypothetical protein DWQ05_05440 [Calditrichaeota bacterium]|nr:MAG: hypothetical protein DWQ05_05440 [Calditrichota bacterium]